MEGWLSIWHQLLRSDLETTAWGLAGVDALPGDAGLGRILLEPVRIWTGRRPSSR